MELVSSLETFPPCCMPCTSATRGAACAWERAACAWEIAAPCKGATALNLRLSSGESLMLCEFLIRIHKKKGSGASEVDDVESLNTVEGGGCELRTRMWRQVLSWVASIAMAICMRMIRTVLVQEGGEGEEHSSKLKASNVERPTKPRMREIGGLRRAKRELRECVLLPMRHPDHFYKGPPVLRPPRGVLLHGPPGTGKTLLAKAVAAEARVPLLSLHAATLESKWYGEGPKTLQAAFSLAKGELSPCVVFFDEVDAIGRERGDGDPACVYSLKCEMLRNLDEVKDFPVAVLACTNCPGRLDGALRRRMERSIHVGVPTREERRSILGKLDPTLPGEVLDMVASKTGGMTGAGLSSLLREVHARRSRSRAFAKALASTRDGHALMRALGPLTGEEWAKALGGGEDERGMSTRSS